MPGAIEMQHLHSDGFDVGANGDVRLNYARESGYKMFEEGKTFDELDIRLQRLVLELTPPSMTINFAMTTKSLKIAFDLIFVVDRCNRSGIYDFPSKDDLRIFWVC